MSGVRAGSCQGAETDNTGVAEADKCQRQDGNHKTTEHLPLQTVHARLSNSEDKLRLSFEVVQLQLWDADSSAFQLSLGLGFMLRSC